MKTLVATTDSSEVREYSLRRIWRKGCTVRRQVEKCMMMQDYTEYGIYIYIDGIKIN